MFKVHNTTNRPLGLPFNAGVVPAKGELDVRDSRVIENPVVINWLRSGNLTILGGVEEPALRPVTRPRAEPDAEVLKVLDNSIPDIEAALPDLTDEEFDLVVRAEKNGKTRTGLVGPQAVFDREWKRRFSGNGTDA